MISLPPARPDCFAAAFCCHDQPFSQDIRTLDAASVRRWRGRFLARLRAIARRYLPRREIDRQACADIAASSVEGGRPSRRRANPSMLPRRIPLYRELIRATFQPE